MTRPGQDVAPHRRGTVHTIVDASGADGGTSPFGWPTSESFPGVPVRPPAIAPSATSGQARHKKETDDLGPEIPDTGNLTRTDRGLSVPV